MAQLVLVVDDDPAQRRILEENIKRFGYRVLTADGGTMALGYAGWEANQLEDEIKANAWLTTPATPEIVFDAPLSARWDRAARDVGVTRAQLTGPAGHA